MNIEKTISEHAVSDILTPMLDSQDRIVTEDVAPLFDQATGLDTPPASGTVTTTIEESRSVITAIIRKAWTATLTMLCGASVIGYITAAYTYLRNRLQGNETYGIPDRRSEISASSPLAANLALLNDRKIGGVPEAVDGISLVQLLCATNSITEFTDNTTGWAMTKAFPSSLFPNITKAHFGCAGTPTVDVAKNLTSLADFEAPNIEGLYQHVLCQNIKGKANMEFGSLKKIEMFGYIGYVIQANDCENLSLPELHTIHGIGNGVSAIGNMASLQTLRMPKLTDADSRHFGDSPKALVQDCAALQEIEFGGLTAISRYGSFRLWYNCPNVAVVKFGQGVSVSLNLDMYNPTLDSSNLQQFLSNFREYIAKKLTDNGSGKTLTLSQAVFSEIWDSQGQPQVKGDGLDDLRADIHRIIRTDKQWAVNKA